MELREKINQVRSDSRHKNSAINLKNLYLYFIFRFRCELLDVKEKLQEYNVIYRGSEVQKMAEAAAL